MNENFPSSDSSTGASNSNWLFPTTNLLSYGKEKFSLEFV